PSLVMRRHRASRFLLSFRWLCPLPSPLFFFQCYGPHRDLHSFPTRRSSDLTYATAWFDGHRFFLPREGAAVRRLGTATLLLALRSEEHTSELQSLTNLVCRLLLEKKKKKKSESTTDRPRRGSARVTATRCDS